MITQDTLLSKQEIESVQSVFLNHINAIKYKNKYAKEKVETIVEYLTNQINNIKKYSDIKEVSRLVDKFITEREKDVFSTVDSVNVTLLKFLLDKIDDEDTSIADLSHFDPGKPVPS